MSELKGSLDECRKTFEKWCFDYNGKHPILDEHGGYGLGRNYDRWQAWQAAWKTQQERKCPHDLAKDFMESCQ